jgi:hypothetical protein
VARAATWAAAFEPRQHSCVFFTAYSVFGMATSVCELKKIGCFYSIWVSCSVLTRQNVAGFCHNLIEVISYVICTSAIHLL